MDLTHNIRIDFSSFLNNLSHGPFIIEEDAQPLTIILIIYQGSSWKLQKFNLPLKR